MTEFPDYYDREGKAVDLWAWAALYEDINYVRVIDDDVLTPDGEMAWVSTVWLGLNHNYFGDGPPLIFETAVFRADQDVEIWCRYSTEQSARQGHSLAVASIIEGLD